jgi:hypothetical protein
MTSFPLRAKLICMKSKMSRQAYALQKSLKHDSNIHASRDKLLLRKLVIEFEELVQNCRGIDTTQFRTDIDRAHRAIVAEPKPSKKEQKPDLVVEDDLEL